MWFKNIKKKLELYEREERLKIDERILTSKKAVVDNEVLCATQMREQECDFHTEKERLGIEIDERKARIAALIDNEAGFIAKKEALEWKVDCINNEAERLHTLVKTMTETLGKFANNQNKVEINN